MALTDHADHLFVNAPLTMRFFDEEQALKQDIFVRAMRAFPWLIDMVDPEPVAEREPEPPNAETYPTLAATGFIFAEAIDLGPVTKPASACPTCGRLTERVEALT